ncbi:MAG: hypothetical protein K6T78_15405 [Alicyclobacillus sp.]|nr:hypothetical protein [Alicyclobacillus sp.]
MDEWTQPEWKILSILLAYPGDAAFDACLDNARTWADELCAVDLRTAAAALQAADRRSLIEAYVAHFDFQTPTCLYLTAHELGDSRRRGLALVALRRMMADAGLYEASLVDSLEYTDGQPSAVSMRRATSSGFTDARPPIAPAAELPDYIPLLFEFLAAKPAAFDTADLEIRLARVCTAIATALPEGSLYAPVFAAALRRLPACAFPPGGPLFAHREQADLDPLPYPLWYD